MHGRAKNDIENRKKKQQRKSMNIKAVSLAQEIKITKTVTRLIRNKERYDSLPISGNDMRQVTYELQHNEREDITTDFIKIMRITGEYYELVPISVAI